MKRHNTIPLIFCLLVCFAINAYTQDANMLSAQNNRHHVFLSSSQQSYFLNDLEIGKNYTIQVTDFNQVENCFPSLNIAKHDFKATQKQHFYYGSFVPQKSKINLEFLMDCLDENDVSQEFLLSLDCVDCITSNVPKKSDAQGINVQQNNDADYLIRDVFLAGNCFEVDNITSTGMDDQFGEFSNATLGEGLVDYGFNSADVDLVEGQEGIILSTGRAVDAEGPNSSTSTGEQMNLGKSDPDLMKLIGSSNIHDVVALEFDFTPTISEISFEYIFASEEYCEYVGSTYNDVFGFFISGPGINGTFSNGAINIAKIPGSSENVSINSVNFDNTQEYYIKNARPFGAIGCTFGEAVGAKPVKNLIEYDGLTTTLTAVANVIPCETYHIKLVIGDVSDGIWDSAVLLKANSFKAGGSAGLSVDIPSSIAPSDGLAIEGCQESFLLFERKETDNIAEDLEVHFTISDESTASEYFDYEPLTSPITIPKGQESVSIPLTVISDMLPEGPESIIFVLDEPCSCEGEETSLTIVESEPFVVELADATTCEGGAVDLIPEVSGNITNVTYSWNTGSTDTSITEVVDVPSTFTLEVTDGCGQTITAESDVTFSEQVAEISGEVLYCNGVPQGEIVVNFTGAAPYNLEYEFNGDTRNISNIESATFVLPEQEVGIYEAIAMTSNGCDGTGEGTAEITTTEVNIEYSANNPKCHKSTDGFIEIRMNTDTGNTFQYAWSSGEDVAKLENLVEGEFEVTVTNELGCEAIEMFTIRKPEQLTATLTPDGLANCYEPNAGSIDLVIEGGTPGYAYEWSNGAGSVQNPTGLEGGTYSVEVTDLNGCKSTFTTEILSDFEEPLAEIQVDDIISCRNDNLTLTAIGTSRGFRYKYNWTTEDGGNIERFESRLEPVVNRGGTYILEVLDESNGCITTETAFVKEDTDLPDIELIAPMELNCQIESQNLVGIILEQMVDFSLDWSSDDGNFLTDTDMLEPEIDAAGKYTLLVTNNINGCMNRESVDVIQNIIEPQFLITNPKTLTCDRNAVSIKTELTNPEKEYQIVWETTEGNFLENRNTLNPSVDEPGVYNLKITDTENFCEATEQVNIEIDTLSPKVDAGGTAVFTCDINQMNLNGTIVDNRVYDYQWTTDEGSIISGENTLTPSINEAGTYQIFVKDEINGCEAMDLVVITDDINRPKAVIETPASINCDNQTVQLDASNSTQGGVINYRWETFDGNILDRTNPINPIIGSPGTYLLFVVDQTNGCEGKGTVKVGIDTISPTAIIAANDVFNCKSEKVEIDGTASSAGSNYQYNWSTTDGNIISKSDVVSPAVGSAGTYVLEIRNIDNGCTAETSLIIIDEKPRSVNLDLNQPLCFGDRGQANIVQVVGGVGPYSYSIDGGNRFTDEAGFSYLDPGSYNLVVKDINDCELAEVIKIVEPEKVVVDLGLQQEIGLGDSINLEAITNIPEGQVGEIMWSPAVGLSCDDCLNPMAKPFQSVEYEVTVIDQNGCEANSNVRLIVDQTPQIYVPNVFNPTSSQVGNDRFTIFSKQGMVNQIITLEVYNRWGETVFQRKNFAPNDPTLGWDGNFNRKRMRPAVFVYRAELEMIDGRTVQIKGDFTLMN